MRKIIFFVIVSVLTFSCSQKEKKQTTGFNLEKKIPAVYFSETGTPYLDVVLMVTKKTVVFDTSLNKDVIVVDTAWGVPKLVPVVDSTNNPVVDSLGNPVKTLAYFQKGKDSIFWQIENKNIDSLISAFKARTK
jgi:hypothetical protein